MAQALDCAAQELGTLHRQRVGRNARMVVSRRIVLVSSKFVGPPGKSPCGLVPMVVPMGRSMPYQATSIPIIDGAICIALHCICAM